MATSNKNFKVKNGLDVSGTATASSFVKTGGTSSEFLKADGSVSFANVTTVRTNLVTNPNFETNLTSWTSDSDTLTRVSTTPQTGSWCARVEMNEGDNSAYYYNNNLTIGLTYRAAVWVRCESTSQTIRVRLDAGSASSETSETVGTTWQKITLPNVISSTNNDVYLNIKGNSLATFFIDSAIIELSSAFTAEFFDGSTTDTASIDYAWTGTANASTSTATLHAASKQYVDTSISSVTSAFQFADGEILGDLATINTSLGNKQDKVANVSDVEIGYLDGVTSSIQTQLTNNQTQLTNKQDIVSDVSNTEIGYLNGVTSAIQTQINNKQDKVTDVSDIEIGYLNGVASAIQPQLDNKQDKVANVSDSEIGHLNGVTSAIQTQIDAKLDSGTASGTYAPLNNPTFGGTVTLPLTTSIGEVSSTEIGYVNGVTSAIQTQIDTKAPSANPTFTGTVSGVTKTHVGLDNVDNTSDASKPISTATQSALDAKASLSGAVFTANVEVDGNLVVDGNLTVNGTEFIASATSITIEDNLVQIAHTNPANTVDLGIVVGYNDGTVQHAGIVRDVSANTWKLFKGVETEPATTVAFSEGSLDDLELNNIKAAGVVFTDGTQTKAGVPSLTTFVEKTASYTLDTLAHQDNVIEMNSTSPTTFTIPTNATLAWPIGASMDIFQTNTGEVTIDAVVGVTLNKTPGNKLRTQWSSATILKRGTDNWILYGDLKA